MLIKQFCAWRRRRILNKYAIEDDQWDGVASQISVLTDLTQDEWRRLRELSALFLHGKRFVGLHGLEIDNCVRLTIAAQACLLVLNINDPASRQVYPGWQSIVLYPGPFVTRHDILDETGIVHEEIAALDGEASEYGPVVLSWEDAHADSRQTESDRNVVLHEFAHKLDFLDGTSNGHPPLHHGMSSQVWSDVFTAAFEDLNHLIENHHHTLIDPYAATNPAEFFAVTTEVFFQSPRLLQQAYPGVYEQLRLFYRQDPALRHLHR